MIDLPMRSQPPPVWSARRRLVPAFGTGVASQPSGLFGPARKFAEMAPATMEAADADGLDVIG
jgi:hypothetical protein